MMRFAFAFAVAVLAGCPSTTVVTDLAIVTGCHQPRACLDPACGCNRGDVLGGSCVLCAPSTSMDNCGTCGDGDGGTCSEPSQLCYGRGLECPGVGATCVPAGAGCDSTSAAPPEPVTVDGGTVPRCAYHDDVCCPGHQDLGMPDLAGSDLSAVVPMDLATSD